LAKRAFDEKTFDELTPNRLELKTLAVKEIIQRAKNNPINDPNNIATFLNEITQKSQIML